MRGQRAVQGTFLIAGNTSEAFAAMRAVFSTAQNDVLLVDADADGRTLTDCAVLVPVRAQVRLLTQVTERPASLASAARHWVERFGEARLLTVRVAAAGTIHDKLIVVDNAILTAHIARQPGVPGRIEIAHHNTVAGFEPRRNLDINTCGAASGHRRWDHVRS